MIKKGLFLFIIACLLALELPAAALAETGPAVPGRTVSQQMDGLLVSWQTPPVQTSDLPDGSHELRIEGFDSVQTPGQPRLPEDSMLIALPAGANPTLEVQIGETETFPAPEPIALVPGTVTVPGDGGAQVFDLTLPAQAAAQPVTLEEIGVMRGVRLARLTFHPVRLENGSMEVIRQAAASVHYGLNNLTGGFLTTEEVAIDAALTGLASEVINPTQLSVSAAISPASTALVNRTGQAVIEVSASGLTGITQAALSAAGFPVGAVNPGYLHLERGGVEISTQWDGDGDAAFEPGEQLLFYAQPRFSRWTARDVYFLSVSSAPRKTILQRTVIPSAPYTGSLWMDQLFEQNTIYTPDCYCAPIPAGRDGDRWVWDMLRKPDRTSATYPASLAAVDETQPAEITVWLIGFTDVAETSHTVQVRMNGTPLGDLTFSGKQANPPDQATLSIPAGVLRTGSNDVTLSLADAGPLVDGVWLDAFSIHFARGNSAVTGQLAADGLALASQYAIEVATMAGLRAYDVTDANNPVSLQGIALDATHAVLADPSSDLPRRYALAPSGGLLAPDVVRMAAPLPSVQGADYIMISPQEFIPNLAELVSLRESQGLDVVVADVRAIYDAVDGRPQPQAIHAFLADAYARWVPRPAYVMLVGDGTTDPRQYRSGSSTTWIPPFLIDVDPVIGEIAADNRYVMVDGDDLLPDLSVGRLPVNSQVEAAITVTKIVQYDRNPARGEWSRRMLLVSDKDDPNAGYFTAENEIITDAYASSRYQLDSLAYETTPSQVFMHQAVLAGWNQGYGVILYNGHASTHQWGADILLHLNDLPSLANGNRLPVLLEMTCLTSSFQVPNVVTLDETLLRRSGKGAVATWGSTGLGLSSGAMLLAEGVLDPLMADKNVRLGDAIAQAKLNLVTTAPALDYLVDTYTLLGDPAMKINFRFENYLPNIRKD